MKEEDKTVLIRDLEHRVACVREAGGSFVDGSAKDGYFDIPSLLNVCMLARNRARELDCIEAEFTGKSLSASIHKDEIATLLRKERSILLARVKEAEDVIEDRRKRIVASH